MSGIKSGIYVDTSYRLHYPQGASHTDGIPDDLKEVIHEFWGTFPPQHPLIADVYGIIIFLLFLISALGNGCVIYIFITTKSLRTPTNMFIVNLAFSDLCMITTQGLPVAINVFSQDFWMWGAFGCRLYACLGGIFGTVSLLSMVVIGFDRYNVIVKGFSGYKITAWKAVLILLGLWIYGTAVCVPPFLGWGGYSAEGLLVTCSYDYLTEDWSHKSFVLYAFIGNYLIPMSIVIFFYSQIVKAVVSHEAALKAQAKKMNVESLRSNTDANAQSAEMRIAKVAITNVCLWAGIWTPYAVVVMIAAFGDRSLITPLVSSLPAFFAKLASVLNPIVFAISHPKYREALGQKIPCLGIRERSGDDNATQSVKQEDA